MSEESEDIRKRQLFGRLERILLSPEGEIYVILSKDKLTQESIEFLKSLEKKYGSKDIILTFHTLIRGKARTKERRRSEDEIEWQNEV